MSCSIKAEQGAGEQRLPGRLAPPRDRSAARLPAGSPAREDSSSPARGDRPSSSRIRVQPVWLSHQGAFTTNLRSAHFSFLVCTRYDTNKQKTLPQQQKNSTTTHKPFLYLTQQHDPSFFHLTCNAAKVSHVLQESKWLSEKTHSCYRV